MLGWVWVRYCDAHLRFPGEGWRLDVSGFFPRADARSQAAASGPAPEVAVRMICRREEPITTKMKKPSITGPTEKDLDLSLARMSTSPRLWMFLAPAVVGGAEDAPWRQPATAKDESGDRHGQNRLARAFPRPSNARGTSGRAVRRGGRPRRDARGTPSKCPATLCVPCFSSRRPDRARGNRRAARFGRPRSSAPRVRASGTFTHHLQGRGGRGPKAGLEETGVRREMARMRRAAGRGC